MAATARLPYTSNIIPFGFPERQNWGGKEVVWEVTHKLNTCLEREDQEVGGSEGRLLK